MNVKTDSFLYPHASLQPYQDFLIPSLIYTIPAGYQKSSEFNLLPLYIIVCGNPAPLQLQTPYSMGNEHSHLSCPRGIC